MAVVAAADDDPTDEAMQNLLSHVSDEDAAEALDEAAPDMTPDERKAWLKRWGK